MLDYTTNNMSEIIKSVFINDNGLDGDVDRIMEVDKQNGNLVETEIWPTSPRTLQLKTSYDFYDKVKKLPDSAYSGPSMTTDALQEQPLVVTVSSYPSNSRWRLEHSPNIADDAVFQQSYHGTRVVEVPISLVDAQDEEPQYCWIKAVPDVDGSSALSPMFKFYVRNSISGEGEGEGDESEELSEPLFRWTFDNPNDMLRDEISGATLANYKNRYSLNNEAMISTRLATGYKDSALRAVNITVPELNCILGDDGKVYKRLKDGDQEDQTHAKYCWIEVDLGQDKVYTSIESDFVGNETLYDITGQDTGKKTVENFATESNYYSCHTGLDLTDPDKEYTIAFYGKYHRGYNVGFREFLDYEQGYYNATPYINDGHYQTNTIPKRGWNIKNLDDFNGWQHFALSKSRELRITDPDNAYTEERGYGFVIYRGLYVKDVGHPYVRDEGKDANGKFAFTWTDGGISNNTLPVVDGRPIHTVWLDSTTPASGDIAYGDDGETQISTIRNSEQYPTIPYRVEYIDKIHEQKFPRYEDRPELVAAWVGPKSSFGRLNLGAFHEACVFKQDFAQAHARLGYFYLNGYLITIGAVQYASTYSMGPDGDLFRIKLQYLEDTGDQKFDGVDHVCIYDRMLSDGELKALQDKLTKEKVDWKEKLNVTYNVEMQPKKILVNGTWYYQDPDLTYFSPKDDDDKFAYFGWRKLEGDGSIDCLWTEDPSVLSIQQKCIIAKGGTPSESHKIQDIQVIKVTELPLKCDLVPYIIDSKTIAIVIDTHDNIVRCMRMLFPGVDAVAYNSENGYLSGYVYGFTINCLVWRTHGYCQNEICARADEEGNWSVDGNAVTLYSRTYTAPYDWGQTKIQWRNCQPGDKWYAKEANTIPADGHAPEIMQVAYIKLAEPMQEGTTHTISWCGNTCEVKYSHEFACSTIKVNQEGYLPWANTKRAYLGRWMGAAEGGAFVGYMPDESDRTFYLVPYSHPDIEHSVFSGTMTQRCVAGEGAQRGDPARVCSDRYGTGGRPHRPMTGENVFQLDFSGADVAVKDALTLAYSTGIAGALFYRDEVEDYVDGTITVDGNEYSRCFSEDTCNAYAWVNDEVTPRLIYTDTHIPATGEKARLGYDDFDTMLDITSVTSEEMLGWTTERVSEEDYRDAAKVWTHGYPEVGDMAFDDTGFGFAIDSVLKDQETQDISGYYQIYIPNIGWSFRFLLHPQAYFHAYYIAHRGMFHQRSGCAQVRHPYTNWEYLGPAHEIPYRGNFCPQSGPASDINQVWAVDPVTHEEILNEMGNRIYLSVDGSAFSQNSDNNKYDTQPIYGLVGGWFDAADFDMREFHIPIVRQLAIAYCMFPDNFSSNQLDLPESKNGIPDILNEAMWGAQLWLNSQEPDGGIHGWFETHHHESDWPWQSTDKYYCCAASMRHSMTWASSAATLARALRIAAGRADTDEARVKMLDLSRIYTDSACSAFAYATKEFYDLYMKLPDSDREPSSYFESQDRVWAWIETCSVFSTENTPSSGLKSSYGTDMFKAVCSLYALTKEERYRKYINDDMVDAYIAWFGDQLAMNTTDEVAWELISCLKDEFPQYFERIKSKYASYSDFWINMQEQHPYRWFTFNPGHKYVMNQQWGSAHPDCRCGMVLAAWVATGNEKYRDAVIAALDQVYGCNNLGRSWVVQSGYVFPATHLDSWQPKHKLNNDLWASRPGISPYYIGHNERPDYKVRKMTVGLEFEGRVDQNCPPIKCNAMPRNI